MSVSFGQRPGFVLALVSSYTPYQHGERQTISFRRRGLVVALFFLGVPHSHFRCTSTVSVAVVLERKKAPWECNQEPSSTLKEAIISITT